MSSVTPTAITIPAPDESVKKNAPSVMLVGDTGEGKSYAIRTLVAAGITPFVIMTEPSEVLDDLPAGSWHYKYLKPATQSWGDMASAAKQINTLSFKALTEVEHFNKSKYNQLLTVYETLNRFVADDDGKDYGDVATWGEDRAIVIDSLSGLSLMAMGLVVGGKPVKAQGQWGIAMDTLEQLINKLCADTRCWFVMTAHLEREQDEVSGSIRNYPSTLGKKLAPKLPRFFSDVIHCRREVDKFYWSTISVNTVLKTRNLPLSDKLEPSFVPIAKAVAERRAKARK